MKFYSISLLVAVLLSSQFLIAQPTLQWGKYTGSKYRDDFQAMAMDSSDNIFLAGTYLLNVDFDFGTSENILTSSNKGKIFIAKYDSEGNISWAKSIGNDVKPINIASIATDTAGNIVITGSFSGIVDFDPNSGVVEKNAISGNAFSNYLDIFILKLTKDGDFMWVQQIGKSAFSESALSIKVDKENNIYATGQYGNPNGAYNVGNNLDFIVNSQLKTLVGHGMYIAKLNESGEYIWVKSMMGSIPTAISQDSPNGPYFYEALVIDNQGDILIGGYASNFIYDQNGTSQYIEFPSLLTYEGDLFDGYAFILKIDSSSNVKWFARTEGNCSIAALSVDKENNVYYTGVFSVDTVDLDPGLNKFPLIPNSTSYYGNNIGFNQFITKLNSDGNFMWGKEFKGSTEIRPHSITVNSSGDVFLTGNMHKGEAFDFDPGSGIQIPTSMNNGYYPLYLCILSSNGEFSWVGEVGLGTQLKSKLMFNKSECDLYFGASIGVHFGGKKINDPEDPHEYEPRDYDPGNTNKLITTNGFTDIYLAKFATDFKPHITPLSNLSFCAGDSVVLDAGGGYVAYQWSPTNETTRMITVNTSGKYFVTATKTCGTGISDTVTTKVAPNPTVIITGDSSICEGKTTTLKAEGGKFYSWNTGSTHDTTMVAPIGKTMYTVTVTDTIGCVSNDSVEVTVNKLPIASVGSNQTICSNDSISLTGTGGTTALWSNGGTSHTITVSPQEETTYIFTALNGGCADTASVTIFVLQSPEVTLSPETGFTMPQGSEAVLTVTGEGNYVWTPSEGLSCSTCPNPTATPIQHTTYCVTVTNEANCKTTKCIPIKVECGELFVPNSFSPNGDKINDILEVKLNPGCISEYEFSIYDRWGEKLFNSTKITESWDGTFDGKILDNAVFVYALKIKLVDSPEFIYKKGNVSILK